MERGLVVVGATAIEDKLQEGVPGTIAHLLEAGIKVWVLTGDKMETAINIGYSCRLLTSSMVLVKITEKGDGGVGGGGGADGGVGVGGAALANSSNTGSNTSSPPGREREKQRQLQEAHQDAEEEAALRQQLRRLVTHFERLVEDTALSEGLWPAHTAAGATEQRWWQRKHKHRKSQRQSGLRRRSSFLPVAVPSPLGEGTSTSMLPQPLIPFPPPPSSPGRETAADAAAYLEDLQSDHLAVIIDGPALARIFGDGEMERLLLRVATLCKSVVACRVSPAQKRMLIRLVKKGVRRPTPITLAIGDGANDVAMIQEAQIGVGISGREGRQAVNSADFAIAQFRFLEPLLLKHGRWNYRRIALVILYSFYKNIVLTFILFFYTWCAGFSGQPLFEDLTYSAFNFFLAMPIICVGFFDRDLEWGTITGEGRGGEGGNRHRHTHSKGHGAAAATTTTSNSTTTNNNNSRSFRWAYMSGRENLDLNLGKMTLWLVQAVLDSVLIFCFSFGAINAPRQVVSGQGDADDLYLLGLLAYTGMLLATLYKTASNTYTWTWVNGFFFVGSLLLYLIYLFVYGAMPVFAGGFYGTPYIMFTRAFFWLVAVVLVPAISVVVDYTFIYLRLALFPSPVDIAVEVDRGYGPPLVGEEEGGEEEERVRLKKAEEEEVGMEEGVGGGEGEGEEEEEGRKSGWYPGKLLVSLDLLRRLNRLVTQKEKEEMGISDHAPGVLASSYDYTSTSMDLGPGGGER
jgi:magnesium-transporting ATPase (P-type)